MNDFGLLEGMYNRFTPKGRFQGLPPPDKEERAAWIKKLLQKGGNYLAWRQSSVIGHVVVLPEPGSMDAECLIFIDQFNRGLGVGTELIRAAINKAKDSNMELLWLVSDADNIRAMRLYNKCGFRFSQNHKWESERMMLYRCRELDNG